MWAAFVKGLGPGRVQQEQNHLKNIFTGRKKLNVGGKPRYYTKKFMILHENRKIMNYFVQYHELFCVVHTRQEELVGNMVCPALQRL